MNLEFSEDQKFVQQTARDFLAERCGLDVCRRVLESPDVSYDPELWKGAAEMGWLGAVVPEELGGAGLGHLELVLIAQEIGRALAPIPFASSVYLATEALLLAGSDEQKKRYLPRLAAGDLIGTFAFAEGAAGLDAASLSTRFERGSLHGEKLPVLDGDVAGLAVVVARDGGAPVLALVELDGEGVTRTPLASFDPSRSQARVAFDGAPAELLGAAGDAERTLSTLLDRAAVLVGFEQLGGAERCLELTREQALSRYAFGRPVGSFQAIKHRLADLFATIELARSNGYYAAWALSSGSDELELAACTLRASASDAFDLAAQDTIQIHGGVGFTWEYDCHLFYRRAKLLGAMLDTATAWRERLVARLEARDAA
jgi:alkylation response protein AidB-like acyl-CoA dehydrogenase